MKFSVSSYCFKQYLSDGRMTLLDTIEKAGELGFDAYEFVDFQVPKGEDAKAYIQTVRAALDKAGLAVSGYSVGGDFLKASVEAEVARLKPEVDLAEALGAKVMRHDASFGFPADFKGRRGFEFIVDRVADGYRQVTEYAQKKGVKTTVENHGLIFQDSNRVELLINKVDHPNFGALVDVGNFLCADEDPAKAVGVLAPYAFHAHVKDFLFKDGMSIDPGQGWFQTRAGNYLRGAILGHGVVPIVQCVRLLKNAGYEGYITVEFEGMEDCLLGLALGLAYMKKHLG